MATILFFTAKTTPSAAETTHIGRLTAKGHSVKIRSAAHTSTYGGLLESCDGVAGSIPSAYNAKDDYSLPPIAQPETLKVLPATATKAHPGTQQLQVLKAEQDETTKAITITDVTASSTFASSVEAKATVDANGLITTVAAGETEVTATDQSVAAAKAELDCGAVVNDGQLDTILEAHTAGTGGNAIDVALVADGTGTGSVTRSGNHFTLHYEPGVTTVTNIETAIAALGGGDDLIDVKTGGTGARVLDANAAFPAQPLTGGAAAVTSTSSCVFTVT